MRVFILMLVFIGIVYAEDKPINTIDKPINTMYSFKNLSMVDLSNEPAENFNNTTIKGSSFYRESKYNDDGTKIPKDVFPKDMKGVVFDRCNLDNVKVPNGNTILPNCSHRKIKVQSDGQDWILDESLNPVEPVNPAYSIKLGLSINPEDL